MYIMGVLGGERERTKNYRFEEIMAKYFPNLLKNINVRNQEAQ